MRQDELLKKLNKLLLLNHGKVFDYLEYQYKIDNGKLYFYSKIFKTWYVDNLNYWEYEDIRNLITTLICGGGGNNDKL